jgi:hypothetical protein
MAAQGDRNLRRTTSAGGARQSDSLPATRLDGAWLRGEMVTQRIQHHRAAVVSDSQSGLGHPWQWPGNGQSPLPARPPEAIDAVVIDTVRLNTWVVHLPSREKDVEFSASLRLRISARQLNFKVVSVAAPNRAFSALEKGA